MEFSKTMGACGAATVRAWDGMKRTAGNARQNSAISEQEAKIKRMTAEIGRLAVLELDRGAKAGDAIMERYRAILEARDEITQAQGQKVRTAVVCPHCGKKSASGMKYCGWCGEEL